MASTPPPLPEGATPIAGASTPPPLPKGAVAFGPPKTPQVNLDQIIQDAAKKHGIDPNILRAVGEQETQLGKSPLYNPVTGLSRTKGNAGHGIWQLDPASGASPQDLERAAKDPAFAADRAAQMLAANLHSYGGDATRALAAYNAGTPTPVGMKYAQQVLSRIPKGQAPPLPKGAVPIPDSGIHLAPSLSDSVATNLANHGHMAYAHAIRTLSDAARNPATILNAVLGAPQRFIAGGMAQDAAHNKSQLGRDMGTYTSPIDQLRSEIGGGVYGVFHPNDPNLQQQAEHSAGVDKLKSTDPRFRGKAQNFSVDTGFQTATDPLTYVMGPWRKIGESILASGSRLTDKALTSSNELVRNTAANMIPHPDVRLAFTPKGQAAVTGIRNAEHGRAARQGAEDAALLKKYKGQIASGEVPDELRQRLLREAFMYGTPKMRTQALLYGFAPTKAEMSRAPLGVLDYDLKEDYFPHLGQNTMPEQLRVLGKQYEIPEPKAGFEKHQESEQLPPDRLASMEYRLAAGRAAVRHRLIQKRIAEETGLGDDRLHIPADPDKINAHVRDTVKAFNVIETPDKEVEGFRALQTFSNIGRDVLIGANAAPHAKNISMLAYLSGGTTGFGKGLYYAVHGVPDSVRHRLEEYGGGTHFMLSQPSKYSPVRAVPGAVRKLNQKMLDSVDMGMRAARLEQIDRKYGDKLTEYEKMQKVNNDLGAYRDTPAYVHIAQKLGAQFPQWHGYIIPTTIGRAVAKNPQRVESLVRAENNANQDLIDEKRSGYRIQAGGPVDEFGQLLNVPGQALAGQTPTYLASPSILGPIGAGIAHMSSQPQSYEPPGESIGQMLVPYFNIVAPQFGYNPYNSKAPANVRSIAAFFAAYPKAEESTREIMIRDFMEQGMNRFQAENRVMRTFSAMRRYMRSR